MTAQIPETITYKESQYSMFSEPLEDYFKLVGNRPDFSVSSTALWRGYEGVWEIVNERLYLIDLTGSLNDGKELHVAIVFNDFPDRVFAHWFTGVIRIPQGEQTKYVHMGFASQYERELLLHFEKGVLTDEQIIENL